MLRTCLSLLCLSLLSLSASETPVPASFSITVEAGTTSPVTMSASDGDTASNQLTYEVLSGPSHGSLSLKYDPQYYDYDAYPHYTRYRNYTPNAGFAGTDSFDYRVSDGTNWSDTATVTITVDGNYVPVACDLRVTCYTDIASTKQWFPLPDIDEDAGTTTTYTIVDEPAHGSLIQHSARKELFRYVPDAGSDATSDTFTWRTADGQATSNTANGTVLIRASGDPVGRLVVILIDQPTYAEIATRVDRLKADLEAEGFSAAIRYTGTAQENWQYLHDAYHGSGPLLSGAILLGNVPRPGDYDQNYMFLDTYETGDTNHHGHHPHIWVTRFDSRDVLQLRNALDANHHYRNDQSRTPLTAWSTTGGDFGPASVSPDNYLLIWPERAEHYQDGKIGSILPAMMAGGEFIHRENHNEPYVGKGPHNLRAAVITGCSAASKGDKGPDNYQFGYGGNNVFSVGATETMFGGGYDLSQVLIDSHPYVDLFNNREWWGSMLVEGMLVDVGQFSDAFTHFYGDGSLGVKMAGANEPPAIDVFSVSTDEPVVEEPLTITLEASDPDAAASDSPYLPFEYQVDIFADGTDYGRREPDLTLTSTAATCVLSQDFAWYAPHNYTMRVEVMDEWRARWFVDHAVRVRNNPSAPMRINCGTYEFGDWRAADGRMWYHDQKRAGGSWGYGGDDGGRPSDNRKPVKQSVTGSNDDRLFWYFRNVRKTDEDQTWRIPVDDGEWTVTLYFADMLSDGAGQRVLDAWLEGSQVLDGFDCYGAVGAKTVSTQSWTIDISDGCIDLALRKDASSSANAFISAIAVIPAAGPSDVAPVARDDGAAATPGQPLAIPVLANDSDPAGDALSISDAGDPAHGSARIDGNDIVYTSDAGYRGSDAFTYTIADANGNEASAQVTVLVRSADPNRPPLAVADNAAVAPGETVTIAVLANDSDPDGDALSLSAVGASALGTPAIDGDAIVFQAGGLATGTAEFTYTLSDTHGATATATVRVAIDGDLCVRSIVMDNVSGGSWDITPEATTKQVEESTTTFDGLDPTRAHTLSPTLEGPG